MMKSKSDPFLVKREMIKLEKFVLTALRKLKSFLTFAALSQQQGWCPADRTETILIKGKIFNHARKKTYLPTA